MSKHSQAQENPVIKHAPDHVEVLLQALEAEHGGGHHDDQCQVCKAIAALEAARSGHAVGQVTVDAFEVYKIGTPEQQVVARICLVDGLDERQIKPGMTLYAAPVAIEDLPTQDGDWVLVPRQPTLHMIGAAADQADCMGDWWRAMLANRPQVPVRALPKAWLELFQAAEQINEKEPHDAWQSIGESEDAWDRLALAIEALAKEGVEQAFDDPGQELRALVNNWMHVWSIPDYSDIALALDQAIEGHLPRPAPKPGQATDAMRLDWLGMAREDFYNIDRVSAIVGKGFIAQVGGLVPQPATFRNIRDAIDAAAGFEPSTSEPAQGQWLEIPPFLRRNATREELEAWQARQANGRSRQWQVDASLSSLHVGVLQSDAHGACTFIQTQANPLLPNMVAKLYACLPDGGEGAKPGVELAGEPLRQDVGGMDKDGREETLHQMNGELCQFSKRWEIDGDYMRCRQCNRVQCASYVRENFQHADTCSRHEATTNIQDRPWEQFLDLLRPILHPQVAITQDQTHPTQAEILDWLEVAHRDELRDGNEWSMYERTANLIKRLSTGANTQPKGSNND